MKLIIPGPLLMPNLPQAVSQVLGCVGRHVAAVSNFDEAGSQEVPFEMVALHYQQVKEVDPALDGLMVHAPIQNDSNVVQPAAQRQAYLGNLLKYSAMAGIVGFDIYPYPEAFVKIGAPSLGGEMQTAADDIAAYKSWLGENLPNKRHLMVLQGLALRDMFADLNVAFATPPTASQLAHMVAQAGDADLIIWWGQAALATSEQAPWPDILRLTAN